MGQSEATGISFAAMTATVKLEVEGVGPDAKPALTAPVALPARAVIITVGASVNAPVGIVTGTVPV